MNEVVAHFAAESLIEGFPLTFLALTWLYTQSSPCQFVTCDPATISATFPDYVLTLPASPRPLSAAEVAVLQASSCGALPLTSDGWFTMPHDLGSTSKGRLGRSSGFFERVIEFTLSGASSSLAGGLAGCYASTCCQCSNVRSVHISMVMLPTCLHTYNLSTLGPCAD